MAFDPVTAKTQAPQACSNCRARKLKCIWDGGGCERCRASGRKCIYEATSSKASSAQRKSKQQDASGNGNSKRSEAAQSLNTSSPGTSNQTSSSSSSTQPRRPSGGAAAAAASVSAPQSLAPSESGVSSSGGDIDMPSILSSTDTSTVASMLVGIDMEVINPMEMEMDLGGDGSTFSQWAGTGLDVSSVFDADDDVTLAATEPRGMDPWASSISTPFITTGYPQRPSHVKQSSDGTNTPCECLFRVVHLVDEIDALVETNGLNSLDGALAAHKEALGCGARMLSCIACTSRLENMIILALMVDKLVRMCKDVSEACRVGLRRNSETGDDGSSKYGLLHPLLTLQSHGDADKQQHQHQHQHQHQWGKGAVTPTAASRVYSVDSQDEYLFVVTGILSFQLQQLFNLTRQLRDVAAPLASERITQRITACSEAVRDLLSKAGINPSAGPEAKDAVAATPAH